MLVAGLARVQVSGILVVLNSCESSYGWTKKLNFCESSYDLIHRLVIVIVVEFSIVVSILVSK